MTQSTMHLAGKRRYIVMSGLLNMWPHYKLQSQNLKLVIPQAILRKHNVNDNGRTRIKDIWKFLRAKNLTDDGRKRARKGF